MWIDSHCHLDDGLFLTDAGVDERPFVLERARAAQVTPMIVIGSGAGMREVSAAVQWARKEPDLFASIGVHPHDAKNIICPDEKDRGDLVGPFLWTEIEKLVLTEPRVVAVGETGLDLFYEHSPLDTQRALFYQFLLLAKRSGKPLSLHIRDAHDQALSLVKEVGGVRGVVHCFTGTKEEASRWIDLGFLISFSGIVTFPKASQVQEACLWTPLSHILLETDCPYLAPVPMRGKRNEPAYLVHTAEFVAQLRKIPLPELAEVTTQNAIALFQLQTKSF